MNACCRAAIVCLFLSCLAMVPAAAQAPPQPTYLEGHQGAVRDVAVTPDGKAVLTVGVDGTLRIWDRSSGELVRTIRASERPNLRLALSPDSSRAAIADAGGHVALLDVPRHYPLAEVTGLPASPTLLAATSDGQFAVTCDDSQVLRLFDVAKKQQLREFTGAAGGVMGVALMAEAKLLLATSGDGLLRSWNLDNGQPGATLALASPSYLAVIPGQNKVALRGQDGILRLAAWPPPTPTTLAAHGDQVTSVATAADGKMLLWGSLDQQVLVQPEGMPARPLPAPGGRVTSVALAGDGSLAAAGLEAGLVRFWKTSDGADALTLAGHAGAVTSVAFHPKQPLVATAGADGTVRIWRHAPRPAGWTGHTQPAAVLAVSRDGKQALTASADLSVRIWNVADGQPAAVWEKLPQPITAARFTADGESVVLGDAVGNLTLRKIADGQVAWSIGAHSGPVSNVALLSADEIASSGPDGVIKLWQTAAIGAATKAPATSTVTAALAFKDRAAALAGGSDGQVSILDLGGQDQPKRITALSAPIAAIAANAEQSLAVAASTAGDVAVIDPQQMSVTATLSAHSVRAIAVHPQQPKFATAGEDGLVRLFNVPQPPQELALHKAPLAAIAVSPDGKQAVSGDATGAAHRWNLPDATDAGLLTGGKERITSASYRRDGQELATGDGAGIIRLFSAADGAALGALGAHDGAVTGLSFHPGHTQLLSSGADGVLRLWQLPLAPPREISQSAGPVRAMAATGDGSTLIIGEDKSVRIVDGASGQERATIPAAGVTAATLSPDGAQTALVTQSGTLHVAGVADGKLIADVGAHAGAATAVAFRPQGGQIATAGSDGQLRLWEVPTTPRTFSDHTGPITAVAVSPSGQWLATASADKTVRLWNLADGSASWTLGHEEAVRAIAWKPDSSQIAAAAGNQVLVWNMADGQQAKALDKFTGNVAAVVFAPDGASLYAAGDWPTIQQWNLADGMLMRTVGEHDQPIRSLALVAGGSTLISASEEGTIRTWNAATGARLLSISHGKAATALAASGDGRWLAAGGPDKSITLYDLADGGIAQSIGSLPEAPDCLAFSLDHLSLAGGSADGNVRIWNLQGQLQEFIPSSDSPPSALAFLSDHRQLAVGGQKNLVRVHRRALAKALAVSQAPLTSLAWSADGQFVLTAASDKTLKLWNTADSTMTRQFFGQADVPRCVAITKDGAKVVAGCNDKSLRVWNYSDASLLATLLLESAPQAMTVSADGSRIAAAEKTSLRVWDLPSQRTSERFDVAATAVTMLADGKGLVAGDAAGITRRLALSGLAVTVAHTSQATGATFSGDGQRWLSVGADKTLKAWDPVGKPLATLGSCEGVPAAFALRGDGQQLAIAGQDRQVYLWRLDNNQLERKIPAGAAVVSLAYHSSQPKLAAACADGKIRIFNPADGMLLEIVPVTAKTPAVAFAGERLLSAHADHHLRLHTSSLERIVPGHQGAVTSLLYSADGSSLFSGGIDKTVRQWNSADGAAVRTVATAAEAVTGLTLSPDGTRLFAASADKTIRIHNVADGAAVATINSPAPIRSLAIDAAGRVTAASGDDGQIRIFDAKSGALIETLVGASSPATAIQFSRDSQQVIAAVGERSLSVWPLACRTLIAGDASKIHDLAATADGKLLLTSGEDKIVKLWDASGNLVRIFPGSPFPLRSVVVRPDGAQVAAGGDEAQSQPQLWVWNLADAQLQFNVNLPSAISRVMYLDEKRLAVACVDQKVRVLRAADGKLLEEVSLPAAATAIVPAGDSLLLAAADNLVHRVQPALVQSIAAHEGGAAAIVWSRDGKWLFSGGADKLVRQWDAASGTPLRTLAGLTAPASGLAVTDDGTSVLACCGDQELRIWTLPGESSEAGDEIQPARSLTHAAAVRSVAVSLDGSRIVTGADDGLVRVWDAKSGQELERFAGHMGAVPAVAIGGEGRLVVSGGADRTARRWELSLLHVAAAPNGTAALATSNDNKLLFSASGDGQVIAWSTADLSRVRDYAGGAGPIRSLAMSAQGDWLAAGGDDAHLRIWSASEGKLLADVDARTPISSLGFAADGAMLIVACADGILRHYELARAGGKLTVTPVLMGRGHSGAVRGLAVVADQRLALTVGADSKLLAWRITSSQPHWSRQFGAGPIHDLAFRHDGQQLAVAGDDGQVHVLAAADGAPQQQIPAHDGPALALAWRPDGQELATAGRDGSIRIWNAEGKEAAKVTAGITAPLSALAWSADGGQLHAGGRGKLWHVFQRGDQQVVRQVEGHNHPIVALRISASGQRVATLDDSGKLFVWDAASGTPLFHQQLAVAAAYRLAWSPDASEVFVASSDPRVIRVPVPPAAR